MNRTQAAALIVGTAAMHAVKRGHYLGHGASNSLAELTRTGVRRLPTSVDTDDPKLAEALRNATKLVDAMIAARATVYANNAALLADPVIGEQTLGEALHKLCPIWPFCR